MLNYTEASRVMEELYIWQAVNHPERNPDLDGLTAAVDYYVRAAHQKSGGQREDDRKKGYVNTMDGSFERVSAELVYHAINLVMSGYLDKIDCDSLMDPYPERDTEGMKDWQRNEYNLRRAFWGDAADPGELRGIVAQFLEAHDQGSYMADRYRMTMITAVVALSLTGRLRMLRR